MRLRLEAGVRFAAPAAGTADRDALRLVEMLAQALDRIVDGDAALVATAWRTLRLAFASTALALALGLPLGAAGWPSARSRGRARRR